jgi:betaine/carnitine transporter, BCCT family
VLVCLGILVSPLGKVRIGGADATPDFSYMGWFAMLFAAGMGIGLMFFGVLEPVYYFATPWGDQPLMRELGVVDGELVDPATVEAARRMAMAGDDLPLGPAPLGDVCRRGAERWRFSPTTRACR